MAKKTKRKENTKEKMYEVLCAYLTDKNFNDDGSPSNDDDYYMVVRFKSKKPIEQLREEAIKTDDILVEMINTKEVQNLFATEEYAEDSLRIVEFLSEVGHDIN